ncbi:Uncharacterized protein Fot_32203 [Forsythia ovata]|uniref:Uncharacterized protein n=1 Tax=Forsythia ovata TaxID=205694 RepID=A0ABD1T7D0_9LAMI
MNSLLSTHTEVSARVVTHTPPHTSVQAPSSFTFTLDSEPGTADPNGKVKVVLTNAPSPRAPLSKTTTNESSRVPSSSTSMLRNSESASASKRKVAATSSQTPSIKSRSSLTSDTALLKGFLKNF